MILCDLPYGTTACKWDTIIPFEPLWKHYERVIKDNGAIVLFGSEPFLYDQNTMWMLFDNFTAALKALWHYTDAESYRRANVQLRVLDKLTRAFQEDNATIRRELLIRGIALATTLIEDKQ